MAAHLQARDDQLSELISKTTNILLVKMQANLKQKGKKDSQSVNHPVYCKKRGRNDMFGNEEYNTNFSPIQINPIRRSRITLYFQLWIL